MADPRRRLAAATLGLLSALLTALGALASAPARALAQGPAYAATPPTEGALYRDGQDGRYLLGGTWLYRLDGTDVGLQQGWWRDRAATDGWTATSVPNSYNADDLSSAGMAGYPAWYRRDFTLPAHAFARYVKQRDRHWIIRFESVNYRATVWLNGRLVGRHEGAYLPFEFDLRNLRHGVNRLIVRVDNRRGPSDIPAGPGGGWWNFGGILREVYLRGVQRVDIGQAVVRPLLRCPTCAATITEQVSVRNLTSRPQPVVLRGFYGHLRLDFGATTIAPHATWTAQAAARLGHPHLWSPPDPHLYRATITAADPGGHRLSRYVTYSGVRLITRTPDGRLELNGRLLDLRGVNIHEQVAGQGAVMAPADITRMMGWVRDLGATIIRAHYPLNPEFEELADRYGVLLWSEIPVWRINPRYLNDPSWVKRAHAMLEDNILTNQNHPSVLLWSIANELSTPVPPSEAGYIRGAAALARRLDPTRPVGMAISDWPGVACQTAYAPLDVLGFNEYFGWFDAGGGSTDDRDSLSPFLDSLRACYPQQAIMVSEFGFDANRDGPVEERGTYEFQSDSLAFHLSVFDSKPWLSGAIYFALQDFAARPGWGGGNPWPNPPYVQKGMVDLYGNHKPAYSVMQSMYRAVRQIAPSRDTTRQGPRRRRRRPRGVPAT